MLRWGKQVVGGLACGLILAVGCYVESDIEQVSQVPVKDPNTTKTATAGTRPLSKAFDTEARTGRDPSVDQTEKATREYSDRVARGRSTPGDAGSERVTSERFGGGAAFGKGESNPEASKAVGSATPDANRSAIHVDSDSFETGHVPAKDAGRTAGKSVDHRGDKSAEGTTAGRPSRIDGQTVTPPGLSQRVPIEKKGAEGQASALAKPADSGMPSEPLSIQDQKAKAVEVPTERFPIEKKATEAQTPSLAKPTDRVTGVTPAKTEDQKVPPLELPSRLPIEKKATEGHVSSGAKPVVPTAPPAVAPAAPPAAPVVPPAPVARSDSGSSVGEKRAVESPDLLPKPTATVSDVKPAMTPALADRSASEGFSAKTERVDRKESLPVLAEQGGLSAAKAPASSPTGGFVVPRPPDVPSEPAKSRSVSDERKQPGAIPAATPRVEAKTVAQPKPTGPEPARSAQPNQPVGTASVTDADIKAVIRQRLKEVQANPNDLEKQLALRLLYVVDNQPDKALAEIPGTNAPTQAIIQRLMKTVMNASQSKGKDPAAGATQMLDSVEDLRKLLRSHADLQLPAIKLCTKVEGFGVYDEIKPPVFPAGQRNRLIVYCEIKNFRTDPTEDGQYRVLLAQRIKVLNSEGKVVYEVGDDDVPYTSRRPIEDFFLVQLVELPTSLPQGKYLLRLYAEDKLAGKATENQVEFTIKSGSANR